MSSENNTNTRGFRPPAMPLITVDPYFNLWSMTDKLTDSTPQHWTGTSQSICGMAFIDGKPYRFIGPFTGGEWAFDWTGPKEVPALEQLSAEITPTRSIYRFSGSGMELKVTFTTPLLPYDLDILSRPASYIEMESVSADGKEHDVALYIDASSCIAVDAPDQKVTWGRGVVASESGPLQVLRVGSRDQRILEREGDQIRIDWGYLNLVMPVHQGYTGAIMKSVVSRSAFSSDGTIPQSDELDMPKHASFQNEEMVLACAIDCGKVGTTSVSKLVTLVYDDIFSIEYFRRKLQAYWRRNGMGIEELIGKAVNEYPQLKKQCEEFDAELMADANAIGGPDYVDIICAAYRQSISAHKLAVDFDGTPMFFSKENNSNGCIATVDVAYPAAPLYMLLSPELLKAMIEPVMQYATSKLWKYDFAPHDIGTYPLANGQVYGGMNGSDFNYQMPVEESGNMLTLVAVLSEIEGNADYAAGYWSELTKWAEYLKKTGLDPENQLCTDDFAGHLAHNTNLSLKAIVAIACYARMAKTLGKTDVANEYRKLAEDMAARWKEMAFDGDHYRLAFDQSGTWSMKYNIVWDKLLNLDLFDPSIVKTEVEYYKKVQQVYGLPLDNRKDYTKGDWLSWCATLADSDDDFRTLIAPLRKFLNESESRVPFSDWHQTTDGKYLYFRARSVVGGVFIKMLSNPDVWKKWNNRAKS